MTMAYTKPLPTPTPISRPYWEAAQEHRLSLQRCDLGHVFYYPRSHCPECLSRELTWIDCSGKGMLYTYTIARRPTGPGFEEDVPFVIAVVAIEEGPHITSNLVDCALEDIKIGMAVEAAFEDVTDEVTLIKFRPARP
jgi:uncharacterized OB-fold protein